MKVVAQENIKHKKIPLFLVGFYFGEQRGLITYYNLTQC